MKIRRGFVTNSSSGKTVYLGRISYEECEYVIADQVSKLFENLAKADPNKMVIIDGDLSY